VIVDFADIPQFAAHIRTMTALRDAAHALTAAADLRLTSGSIRI
jgi:hypothetical protein